MHKNIFRILLFLLSLSSAVLASAQDPGTQSEKQGKEETIFDKPPLKKLILEQQILTLEEQLKKVEAELTESQDKPIKKRILAKRKKKHEIAIEELSEQLNILTGNPSPGPKNKTPEYKEWQEIKIKGDTPHNGIGDPSITYDKKGIGWMSYTRVEMPKAHTHLAKSTDNGSTWEFVQRINVAHEGQSLVGGKAKKETYDFEMSTIAYDPKDTGREYKIFYVKYLTLPGGPFKKEERLYNNGYVGYRHASDPEGAWSDEIPIFLQGPLVNQRIPRAVNLSQYHGLWDIKYFAEPGALVKDGVIYLCLDARATYNTKKVTDFEKDRVILVASTHHGIGWNYLGTFTTQEDAKKLGYYTFTGSSLIESNGKVYLTTSPSGSIAPPHKGHDGTFLFEVENLQEAKLKRKANGDLVVHLYIPPQWKQGGQMHYHPGNTKGGIIMPQLNPEGKPEIFRIFKTEIFPN